MNAANQKGMRYRWSHQARLHRGVVKVANRLLALIPLRLKYSIGAWVRRGKAPYGLVRGRVCVQVGAPADTLHAGRSRGFYFGLLAGSEGRVLIIEPDPASAAEFERVLGRANIGNTIVCNRAAWDRPAEIELCVDPRHRATNFVHGLVPYSDDRLADYEVVSVPAAPLDDILEEVGFTEPDIISITTNWAEKRILAGMQRALARAEYVALAMGPEGELYEDLMREHGFVHHAHDDRGATYRRAARVDVPSGQG